MKGHQDEKKSHPSQDDFVPTEVEDTFQELVSSQTRLSKGLSLKAKLNIHADLLTKQVDQKKESSLAF